VVAATSRWLRLVLVPVLSPHGDVDDAVMQGLIVAIVDLMFLSTNSYCYYLVWVRKKFRVNYFLW